MFNTLGNTIPTDWARRYTFDGNGNSTTGSNNATVTNPVWIKSQRMYQSQCLSWGATTSCTYASVTYTNSYIWIYSGTTWTFTKNSSKVTATALNGVNGERYAGLTFFNRTLTENEEQLLQLEGQKLLGPTNIAKYPKLFEGLVGYFDFKGTAHNLVNGVNATTNTATLTTDRFGNSNSSYSFNGTTGGIVVNSDLSLTGNKTFHIKVKLNSEITTGTWSFISHYTTTGSISSNILYDYNGGTRRLQFIRTRVGVVDNILNYNINLGTSNYFDLTYTYNGTNVIGYVNGVSIGSVASSGDGTGSFTNNLSIGSNQNVNRFSDCIIDEVKCFNRQLSSDEVKLLYNLTSQDYIYPNPSYDLPSLRDGLVLDLNEQGKDLSGNGNNATLVNSPTVVIQGRAKGFSYNGSNQYISMPSGFGNALGSSFTISFWIKPSRTSGNEGLMRNGISYGGSKNGWDIYRNPTSNSINFRSAYLSVIDNQLLTGNKITTGVWHFCVFTYNGTQSKWYYNGILNDTQSVTGSITGTGDANRSIGGPLFADATKYFQGNLINPKLYNRVLSDKEIQQMYYSQKGNYIY